MKGVLVQEDVRNEYVFPSNIWLSSLNPFFWFRRGKRCAVVAYVDQQRNYVWLFSSNKIPYWVITHANGVHLHSVVTRQWRSISAPRRLVTGKAKHRAAQPCWSNVYIYTHIYTLYILYMFVSIGMYVYNIYIYMRVPIYTPPYIAEAWQDQTWMTHASRAHLHFHMRFTCVDQNWSATLHLTLYTVNCWVLKSWDRLNVFEDL